MASTEESASAAPRATALELTELVRRLEGTLRLPNGAEASPVRLGRLAPPSRRPTPDTVVVLGIDEDVRSIVASWNGVFPGLLVVGDGAVPADYAAAAAEVHDPRRALARLSALFDHRPLPAPGVHASAIVDPSAQLGRDVTVAAGAVIGPGAAIGDGSIVGPASVVGPAARVGAGCRLHANVTLYDGIVLGDRVIVHAGAVLGADGFGYAAGPSGAEKIHHAGSVVIGDDVEIGALTAIDRGTLDDTRVGARTKIDNHCQIGHNVVIGRDCLIAGMTAIGGSAVVEDGVVVAGAVAISDHVTVHAGARIAGRSGVTKTVPAGETWAGSPARPYRRFVRELYLLDRLERIWAFVRSRSSAEDDAPKTGSG